jgi:2-polyprenyl-3-methyl-5-hydroxy-6-metoxy-1,4-benzoquinol methylase
LRSFRKCYIHLDQPLSCPACGNPAADIAYVCEDAGKRSDFFRCRECTFLFARPVLIPELESRQMDGIANAELFNSRILKAVYARYFIKKEIKALRRAKGPGRLRLLDVGCGTGWTTRVYADHGFEVVGLEPSRVRAAYAREHQGIEVVCDYIENAEFDVVVLRHIIEHFADPGTVLRKIRGFLKKDGLLLVVVPNINCFGRYMFETRWAWVLPWHCNFFTPGSLRRFLAEEGFETLEAYQTASPLFPNRLVRWFFGSNRVLAMVLCAPLALIGKWLGMGDNLNAVARVR